jgi:plastocyanin
MRAQVVALLLLLGSCRAAPDPVVHTVTIEGSAFNPAIVTARAGDRVVWINEDFFPHTATGQNGAFDSGMLMPGGSWTFTVAERGTLDYTCTYHPTMRGKVRAE